MVTFFFDGDASKNDRTKSRLPPHPIPQQINLQPEKAFIPFSLTLLKALTQGKRTHQHKPIKLFVLCLSSHSNFN